MAVDVNIGTVETTLSAADPQQIRTPQFMAAIVAMVKEELAREEALKMQRASDRAADARAGRRR
jgi:hypothetical protein